jgi:hypothetical protein
MIHATTEAKISEVITARIPVIEKHRLRPPQKFDGANIPHFGFFRADNGQCLSFASREGYSLTTHDDYIALASAAVDSMGDDGIVKAIWTQSKSRAQATIIVEPKRESRLAGYNIGGGDYIWPRLIIEAPFGSTFNVHGGFYRDACRNLCCPQIAGASFNQSIRHTASLRPRMNELIEICKRSTNSFGDMVASMQKLNEIEIGVVDFLAELYPMAENASENTQTRAKNRATAIYSRLHKEALKLGTKNGDNGKASLWAMVQAVTGYIQWDKNRKNSASDTDRAVMALHDDETSKVWALAESMAS